MKPLAFNLSGAKKIAVDKASSTFSLKNGHKILVAHSALSPEHRKMIEKLPLYKDSGGDIPDAIGSPLFDPSATDQLRSKLNQASDSATDAGRTAAGLDQSDPGELNSAQKDALMADGPPGIPDFKQGVLDTTQAPAAAPTPDQTPATTPDQTSAAPTTSAPMAPSATDSLNVNSAYQSQIGGIKAKEQAEASLATQQAAIEQQNQQDQAKAQSDWAASSNYMTQQIAGALDDVRNGHIKPNNYLENMQTPQKVATAIGLFLGGWSSAYTKQGNPAMDFLNKQIDRDVQSQKDDQNTRLNVYQGYLNQYKNAQVADNMARATQMGIYASKIKEAGDKAGTPLAKANAQMAIGQLQQQMVPLVQNAHLLQQASAFSGANGAGGSGTEAQFKTVLNNARRINPEIAKNMTAGYVPGVGYTDKPTNPADLDRLSNMTELAPLVDKAIADQEQFGKLGTWTPTTNANAASDRNAIQVSLNKMTGLNRLNDPEYQNYGQQVGKIGGVNMGGTLQTLKNLKAQLDSDRNSAITSIGITPFSQAQQPSGLNLQQQQRLQEAQKIYPNASQGDLIKVLRSKGRL